MWLTFAALSLIPAPRHVIEYLSDNSAEAGPCKMSGIAQLHDQVTIMFMDIVGRCEGCGDI